MVSGRTYAWDSSARVWADGSIVAGGSPWRLARLRGPAAELARRLAHAGPSGTPVDPDLLATVGVLVGRGLAHPRPGAAPGPHDVTVVVPAYGRPDSLRRTLLACAGLAVLVVDDGTPEEPLGVSPLAVVADACGARFLRLPHNSGPAAARNAGIAAARTDLVALVDSDCQPPAGWLDALVPHFEDPRVAVVAPRIAADAGDGSLLARYEAASSALDMGRRAALVRPGARLGFVPSATLLVRRSALSAVPFDEGLRLGEDVDLVWRLADTGRHVRYDPSVTVAHEVRGSWPSWAARRFAYGTSSAALEARHPGRLTPLRMSPWNAASLALASSGHPVLAAVVTSTAASLLARRLWATGIGPDVAARVVVAGLVADGVAAGHALRREYWPLGLLALAGSPWRGSARLAVGLMIAPVAAEWVRERPALDPFRYIGVRLLADAAYGTGVIAGAVRGRSLASLLPGPRPTSSPSAPST